MGLLLSPLIATRKDPLILDLDGDGIELTALGVAGQPGASNVYFDYDRDGFAERTGWVSADDGMLAFDANGNGVVDGIGELFGSPSQDGYAVLEILDTNRDGVIDANDRDFAKLRVWRDLNQNGVTDAGELQTLAEAGIASISLTRSDVTGTNAGHDRGFQGHFTAPTARRARRKRSISRPTGARRRTIRRALRQRRVWTSCRNCRAAGGSIPSHTRLRMMRRSARSGLR